MGKFVLEFMLFALILCQISALTDKASGVNRSAVSPFPPATFASADPIPSDFPALAVTDADRATLQSIAQQEAERIIQTGDISSLQRELEKNKLLLSLGNVTF